MKATSERATRRRPASPRSRVKANEKEPFNVPRAVRLIRSAVKPYPKAMLFELASRGFDSVFEQLVACMISIRTRDEASLPVALRLLEVARTPREMAQLSVNRIDELIRGCAFHEAKASQIHEMAVRAVEEFGGELPCQQDVLLSFHGVGPKCANLALGIACGQTQIGVDIHVHRVANRWGYVQTLSPEKTMVALHEKLPRRYWVEINALLVPFGKHICTGRAPKCSTCPVLSMCRQVGVTEHR